MAAGKTQEAYARTLLLMCAGEQVSMDAGSLVLATEMLWEDSPPSIISKPSTINTDGTSTQFPTIYSETWGEIAIAAVQDRLNWEERRSKLLRPSRAPGAAGAEDGNGGRRPTPKWKGKKDKEKADES
jgi:hypothetical protein